MGVWNNKLTELRDILIDLYPDKEDGKLMVDMVDLPKGFVAFSDKSRTNWHNILIEANKRDKVKDIVQIAVDDFPEIDDLKSLFKEVENMDSLNSIRNLRGNIKIVDVEKTAKNNALIKIASNIDKAIEKYDLLVPNRKGLEKIIGEDDLIDIMSWLENAIKQSKAICKVETEDGETGTGFLLNGGFLITNNHVISSERIADNSRIIFNYKTDKENNVMNQVIYQLDSSKFITSSEDELDYTVVKVKDNIETPISEWGFVELESFFNPKIGQKVTIIQHPNGNYMKMALPDDIISVWRNYLFYNTDTREGSSGSPVFNKNWKVVALHHAGKNEQSEDGGFQINEEGDIRPSNRGILVKRILEDLKERNFNNNF
ncbi:MAG: trypsin-like peptidase domain-containing protein [Flavobacterium sp.]|nr:trypsin-like peptidase domain-containing protein [Flavobacterium sp.]